MAVARGVLFAVFAAVLACTPLRSTRATRYEGILLNASDLGAEALEGEMARDPAIARYVAKAGEPDFVLVASPTDVELVYVQPSRLVHFHRDDPGGKSAPTEVTPIPSPLLHLLPRDLRAGTPRPLPQDTACWLVQTPSGPCRTCCANRQSCVVYCR
jgi:hypothetical protein